MPASMRTMPALAERVAAEDVMLNYREAHVTQAFPPTRWVERMPSARDG